MEILQQVGLGFRVALVPINLLLCFLGVLMGTLVGVLPGLGPAASVSLLLPMTFKLSPEGGIIMLSGIMYGAMYGGSTTSIFVNMPGEASSVVTCLDGYQMARQGRAGAALGISAFGSFIAGTLAIGGLILIAPPIAKVALKIGPPEYFSLTLLGIFLLICLTRGSVIKAVMMGAVCFFLSSIGQEVFSGTARFTFGIFELYDGVGIIPVVMGLFGISEVLTNLEVVLQDRNIVSKKISGLLPTLQDWKKSLGPILRGTLIGFPLGSLPGGGAVMSTFASYALDMVLMIFFGIAGYLMRKIGYEPAPVVLGVVLGKVMEPNLRLSLMMSEGSFSIFFTRPISLGFMIAVGILLIAPFVSRGINKFRTAVATDGEA